MDLSHKDKTYLWHPFTQMQDWLNEEQLIISSGKGSYLIDTTGRKYLDGVSSLWVNVHGHRNKTLNQAIIRQLNCIAHTTLLGLGNLPSIELAERLVKITPYNLTKVFYSDSGSTAVEIALKIAFQYWQQHKQWKYRSKTKFISFTNAYHGDTIGSVSVGGMELFHNIYKPLLFQTIPAYYPDCYRCPYKNKLKRLPEYKKDLYNSSLVTKSLQNVCASRCLRDFESVIKKCHRETAAVIIEPLVQGAAGMLTMPIEFLQQVAKLCKEYNVLLIADEVASGFGRTGTMFACQQAKVNPDLMCLAKGITGGYLPLAATMVSEDIYAGFLADYKDQKTFFHGHTYTGNPLACAAAIANLELFDTEHTIRKLQPKIKLLTKLLKSFADLQHVGDIRQQGFMVGIELIKDRATGTAYNWEDRIGHRVCMVARKHGVIIRPLGSVIVLMPPLTITVIELKKLLLAVYLSIEEVTAT